MPEFSWIGDIIKTQGLAGVGLVIMAFALKYVHGLYVTAQEKRISEGLDGRTALERNTSALAALTDVIKERRG